MLPARVLLRALRKRPIVVGVLAFVGSSPARASDADVVSGDRGAAPYVEALLRRADRDALYNEREWHVLLHYRPGVGGRPESEADGPRFFLAPNGKTSPREEMRATLAAFFSPLPAAAADEHPLCRFPARLQWLSRRLEIEAERLARPVCKEFDAWYAAVDARAATLVFASAQLNSPASMYGHTLLRIERRAQSADSPLLSLAINYAADPTTFNVFAYPSLGLTGGFKGRFSSLPYYLKVQEYSNMESRDLWEYRLALDDRQLDRVLRHLWELDVTHFDYYFLSENCSYHLLSLFELADPSKRLLERFRRYTIPVDTVRALIDAGFVESRTYRPSHVTQMKARRGRLTGREVRLAERLTDVRRPFDGKALDPLHPDRQAAVLDAALDYSKFRYGFGKARKSSLEKEVVRRESSLLFRRSTIPLPSPPADPPMPPPPEDGHRSARFAAGTRWADGAVGVLTVGYRPALHDLLDPPAGFVPDSELEMFAMRLAIDPGAAGDGPRRVDSVTLDRLDLVRVTSISPRREWIRKPSWRLRAGGGRVREAGCVGWNCVAADLSVGFGLAYASTFLAQTYYLFLDGDAAAGPVFSGGGRVGGSANAGVLWQIAPRLRFHAEAGARGDLLGGLADATERDNAAADRHLPDGGRVETGASVALTRDLQIRLEGVQYPSHREISVSTAFCF